VSSGEFLEKRSKAVGGELSAVKRGVRKSSESLGEKFRRNRTSVGEGTGFELLGEERGASDCGGAAAAEEANFRDAAVFEAGEQLQDVAANGIGDFDGSGSAGEFTRVARIAEVIENGFAEHRSQYRNPNGNLQRETMSGYFPETLFGGKNFFSTEAMTT
jgi:hypothetical protein